MVAFSPKYIELKYYIEHTFAFCAVLGLSEAVPLPPSLVRTLSAFSLALAATAFPPLLRTSNRLSLAFVALSRLMLAPLASSPA